MATVSYLTYLKHYPGKKNSEQFFRTKTGLGKKNMVITSVELLFVLISKPLNRLQTEEHQNYAFY